jgi:hypothetical protein
MSDVLTEVLDAHGGLERWNRNGYALRTYLTTPFFMSMRGFVVEEAEAWYEGAEQWRHLRVPFPDDIAGHSRIQDFHFSLPAKRHAYLRASGRPVHEHVMVSIDLSDVRFS